MTGMSDEQDDALTVARWLNPNEQWHLHHPDSIWPCWHRDGETCVFVGDAHGIADAEQIVLERRLPEHGRAESARSTRADLGNLDALHCGDAARARAGRSGSCRDQLRPAAHPPLSWMRRGVPSAKCGAVFALRISARSRLAPQIPLRPVGRDARSAEE